MIDSTNMAWLLAAAGGFAVGVGLGLRWYPVSVYSHRQPAGSSTRFHSTHRFALYGHGAGHLRLCCGSFVWHCLLLDLTGLNLLTD